VRICRLSWVSGLCLGAFLCAGAQNSSTAPAYLLRMERNQGLDAVCILVRSDGPYHLERNALDKTEIFEGALSPGDLQKIQHWLSADELFTLKQDKIVTPLFNERKDELILGVNRPGHWQNLRFPASTTREPYQQSVVPLVQWFEEVLKAKHSIKLREEQGRNNCMPPKELKFATRPPPETIPDFLFMLRTTRFEAKEALETCAIVYPQGRFHREVKSQHMGDKNVSVEIYEGSVGETAIESMRGILARPELQNRRAQLPPSGGYMSEGEITSLTVLDAGKPRSTLFWRYVPLGLMGGRQFDESGMKLLEPLAQWLQSNLESKNQVPLSNPSPNDCNPVKLP
jgi:hypothetical protein